MGTELSLDFWSGVANFVLLACMKLKIIMQRVQISLKIISY